jgi:hypothetical protein
VNRRACRAGPFSSGYEASIWRDSMSHDAQYDQSGPPAATETDASGLELLARGRHAAAGLAAVPANVLDGAMATVRNESIQNRGVLMELG